MKHTLILTLVSGGVTRLDHFTSRQQAEMHGQHLCAQLPQVYAEYTVYAAGQQEAQQPGAAGY